MPRRSKELLIGGAIALLILSSGMLLSVEKQQDVKPESSVEKPAPSPVAIETTAETPPRSANDTLILDLFSPSDASLHQQLNEAQISQRIEQILSTSFVLKQCHIIDDVLYRDTFRALIVYAQAMHLTKDAPSAEAAVRRLAESAGTSYALVYSRTKCDHPKLPIIAQQLRDWQQPYLGN
jgi:hypothetical protein